ncbi:MAG: hypothetical protein AB7T49_00235 [Oligoflexales bacterium]
MTILGMGTFGSNTVIVADCVVGHVQDNGQMDYSYRIDKIDLYAKAGMAVTICGDEVVTNAFEFLVLWAEAKQIPWNCYSSFFRDALVECANRLRSVWSSKGDPLTLSDTNVYMCSASGVRSWHLRVTNNQAYSCSNHIPIYQTPGDLIVDCGGNVIHRTKFVINNFTNIAEEVFQEMSSIWNGQNSIPYTLPSNFSAIEFDNIGSVRRITCHNNLTDLVYSLTNLPKLPQSWSPNRLA